MTRSYGCKLTLPTGTAGRACAADHGWAAATARRRTTFELDTLARGQLPHLVGVEVMVGIRVGLGLKLGSGLGSRLG